MYASELRFSARADDDRAIRGAAHECPRDTPDASSFRQITGIDGPMAIVVFVLSFLLLVAGAASGYSSLDLLPTGPGLLYALAGAVAVSAAIVTFALGVAIRRMDALAKLLRPAISPPVEERVVAQHEAPPPIEPFEASPATEGEAPESLDEAPAVEDESPININRSGHLPSLEAIETALETPEAPPSLVGRYSSAGANYKIFDDGSIEAETNEGTFKFASMDEFKRHLIEMKKAKTASAGE
jgi:hypothetical protein